ncbi:MAG: hypothetical protein WCK91_01925 [bacterium]
MKNIQKQCGPARNATHNVAGGYAILFTVAIISIISLIALGLANASYKQLVLTSVTRDSQTAFYQSDTATECGLYADNQTQIPLDSTVAAWSCGVDKNGATIALNVTSPTGLRSDGYKIAPTALFAATSDPCFNITVTKVAGIPIITNVSAKGYNICTLTSLRTVEREIKISY